MQLQGMDTVWFSAIAVIATNLQSTILVYGLTCFSAVILIYIGVVLLTSRWITYVHVLCLCVCCRTTWQALCVTNASPGSSTYQKPTLKAVYSVSAWASPNNAPVPLGIENRWGAGLLKVWATIFFGIKGWLSVCFVTRYQQLYQVPDEEIPCAVCRSDGTCKRHFTSQSDIMFVFLRCEEESTGSSSPSPTASTLKLSLKASPRGAPQKFSTAPSQAPPTTSSTGACLRASKEIRWEEINNDQADVGEEGKKTVSC